MPSGKGRRIIETTALVWTHAHESRLRLLARPFLGGDWGRYKKPHRGMFGVLRCGDSVSSVEDFGDEAGADGAAAFADGEVGADGDGDRFCIWTINYVFARHCSGCTQLKMFFAVIRGSFEGRNGRVSGC